jgi:hypothetical protein
MRPSKKVNHKQRRWQVSEKLLYETAEYWKGIAQQRESELDKLIAEQGDLQRQLAEARAIEVDSGKCILAQLWKDTGGIIPSTGKAWVTGKQLNRTIFGEKLKGGKQ